MESNSVRLDKMESRSRVRYRIIARIKMYRLISRYRYSNKAKNSLIFKKLKYLNSNRIALLYYLSRTDINIII